MIRGLCCGELERRSVRHTGRQQGLHAGSIGKNAMSHMDRVFALIAFAVGLVFTIGLWLLGLL
jgi:hypothetical protein